ncbi:MAG: ice-binding family protein [bacterium]|nr:ice-binding family protein [bacterium]
MEKSIKKFIKSSLLVVWVVSFMFVMLGFPGPKVAHAATAPSLGAADDFAVLAYEAIINSNVSDIISGDVGLSPTTGTFIGIPSAEVAGTIYAVDATGPDGVAGENPTLLTAAKSALSDAYDDAEGQTLPSVTTVDASTTDSFAGTGYTLAPGIYKSPSTMGITGTLTLNGSSTDVWIFQAVSTLTTASATDIVLTGGAQACNVFWQVGSSATLGTNTLFKGNILALTSITDNGGSIVEGRLLASNGTVTLNNTTVTKATCVVPPTPVPTPTSEPQVGGSAPSAPLPPPLINVVKVPTPLALSSGPGTVTYDYVVTNVGIVALSNVTVNDNRCNSTVFVSGDANSNSMLDTNETWMYRCTAVLSETTTNTVTVTGQANGWTAVDTANATVVVSAQLPPPLIRLVKVPSVFVLPVGGGAVTYTYTVTNPGSEPLNNVSIVDDECTGLPGRVAGHPGDLNQNNLLESNETWTFTCQTNITQTTTNTGTAEGHANGLTAIDFSLATVVVAPPGFPETGIAPDKTSILWSVMMLTGVLTALIVIKRRQSGLPTGR